jgi:hypothetical protein
MCFMRIENQFFRKKNLAFLEQGWYKRNQIYISISVIVRGFLIYKN